MQQAPEQKPNPTCPRCSTYLVATAVVCPVCGLETRERAPEEDPLLGRIFSGNFHVQELIGSGGMGRVYRAEHMALARTVAIKVIHAHLLSDPSSVARFYREVRAASRLNHPNSVAVIDFGQTPDGLLYLVMEHLRGRDLAQVMYDEGPLPLDRVVQITQQILSALAEAHESSVVHRDLKPENVLVERLRMGGDLVKVVDFGLAKLADAPGTSVTRPGVVCGTPEYMAPEHGGGEDTDARSDLYSVGVVLFQMLTGQLPFQGDSPTKTLIAHMTLPVPDPSAVAPERRIPVPLGRVTMKALAKPPPDRYQSAVDFAQALTDAWAEIRAAERRASTRQPTAAPVACFACGLPNPGTSRFCNACGARLSNDRSRRTSGRLDTPSDVLVGRADELARLEALRQRARTSPVVVLISGAVGAGKTRLLDEVAQLAAADLDAVASALPHPSGAPVPFHATRTWVDALLGVPPAQRLPQMLDAPDTTLRPPKLARHGIADIYGEPATTPGVGPASRIRAAARALLWALDTARSQALTGRVVLLADDLSRWDGPSRDALRELLPMLRSRGDGVLLVIAASTPSVIEQLGAAAVEQMPIGGISLDQAARLVEGRDPPPAASAGSGGALLPMLAQQLALLGGDFGGVTLGSRLADVVGTRVERLPSRARRVLQAAAAVGMLAPLEAIQAMLAPDSEADVGRALRMLEQLQIARVADAAVHLVHPLLRDIAENSTPATFRVELHARCLDWLVAAGGAPLEVRARHAELGDDPFGALLLLERAGDRALHNGQPAEAVVWLRRGLELARAEVLRGELDAADRAVLTFARKLGGALLESGDVAGADGVLREALAMADPGTTDRVRALTLLARAAVARDRLEDANRYLDQALAGTEVVDRSLMAELWAEAAHAWEASGRLRETLEALRHAATLLIAAREGAHERARLLLWAARIQAQLETPDAALSTLALAMDAARLVGSKVMQAAVQGARAAITAKAGDEASALADYREAARLAEDAGDAIGWERFSEAASALANG